MVANKIISCKTLGDLFISCILSVLLREPCSWNISICPYVSCPYGPNCVISWELEPLINVNAVYGISIILQYVGDSSMSLNRSMVIMVHDQLWQAHLRQHACLWCLARKASYTYFISFAWFRQEDTEEKKNWKYQHMHPYISDIFWLKLGLNV